MTKIRYFGVIFFWAAATTGALWYLIPHTPKRRADLGLPQDTLEEILAERDRVSLQALETPLAKQVLAKDWLGLRQTLDPNQDFISFAEVLRAGFTKQVFDAFGPDDYAGMLEVTLNLVLNVPKSERPKLGLLISQLHRIPIVPGPGDAVLSRLAINEKTDPWGYAIVLHKWVLHAPNPSEDLIRSFQTALKYGWSTFEKRFWIESVDQVRIPHVRNRLLKVLEKDLSRYSAQDQLVAYTVLSKNSPPSASLVGFGFRLLQQNDAASVEAGVRGLTQPQILSQLSDGQKNKLVNRLAELPEALKSPWTTAKSAEVLSTLRAEPNLNR